MKSLKRIGFCSVILFCWVGLYVVGISLATDLRHSTLSMKWNKYFEQTATCSALRQPILLKYYNDNKGRLPRDWERYPTHPCFEDLNEKRMRLETEETAKPWYVRQTEWIDRKVTRPTHYEFEWEKPQS